MAYVVEVAVDNAGAVRVERVVAAVDCGLVVNPIGVEQQIEGGIIWGISSALLGEITFRNGSAQQATYADYGVARMRDTPVIEVHIVPSEAAQPFGMGEPPVPPIAPAIVNAIFAATGKRIRRLPVRPEELEGLRIPGAKFPMKEIADIIREWKGHRGQSLALATLVSAQGSSYRRPGARMLICADGTSAGSLSGGCLEEEVARRAFEVLRTGTPSLMSFDTRLRFGCNGTIEIFLEAARESFLDELAEELGSRRSCRVVTVHSGAAGELGTRILSSGEDEPAGAFVQEIQPPIQLLIFGDGPDSAPLRSFAEILGWRVVEVEHASGLSERADQRTAAVVKSHNYGKGFRRASASTSARSSLRRPAWPAKTARPIGQRAARRRSLD